MRFVKNKRLVVGLSILAFLIIIRLVLPYILLHYANKTLAKMNGYYGHVKDLDLSILRGAYTVKDIYINKIDSVTNEQVHFFDSRVVDLSIEWNALIHGKLVGEMKLRDASLAFTKDKAELAQVQKDTSTFHYIIDKFMPLQINKCEVFEGRVHYIDSSAKPPVNIKMDQAHVIAKNLKNLVDTSLLPASIVATANVYGGNLEFNMQLNPLAESSTFDINSKLENTNLTALNDFFKAYGNFDVHSGTFGMYTEIAAKNGEFVGYVKPVITDLKVLGTEDRHDDVLQKLWESAVGAAGMILRNQKHDQVATKIPMKGTFKNSTTNVWYALLEVLRNAFIQAIKPSIDNEINIGSVKNPPKAEKKGKNKKLFVEK